MARDFEDIHGLDNLNDRELRELVRTHLRAHNLLDVDDISVRVENQSVVLEGRVGTDGERRVAEHVLTDVLGVAQVQNNLVVDAIRRAESPIGIDDHLVEENRTEGLLLGDRPVPLQPEADHLDERSDSRLWGTSEVGKAIQQGTPWIPPESPTPEGIEGTEEGPTSGEDR